MDRLPGLQAAVRGLHGVAWASVVWPDPRAPVALQVTFDPGSDAVEVTRAVLGVLEEVAGLEAGALDVDAVGLGAGPGAGEGRRPELRAVTEAGEAGAARGPGDGPPRGDGPEASPAGTDVVLRYGDRVVRARAQADDADEQPQAVAHAALRALDELLPEGTTVTLDWLQTVPAPVPGHADVVQVAVTLRTGDVEERHVGAALVSRSRPEAAVRAALDAVTRRVQGVLLPR